MSSSACGRNGSVTRALVCCGTVVLLTAGCHQARRAAAPAPSRAVPVEIGYGAQPKRDLTGAVESATAEEMAERKVVHVEEMLEGRFAGLDVVRQPGGEFRLRIRGGRGEPLVVIDGIPSPLGLSNPLSDLAPAWITRIDVLKDAGSTAAYGSRGANGVILITTRRRN